MTKREKAGIAVILIALLIIVLIKSNEGDNNNSLAAISNGLTDAISQSPETAAVFGLEEGEAVFF